METLPKIIGGGAYSGVIKDPVNKIAIKYFKEKNSRAAIKEIALLKYLNHPNILQYDDASFMPAGNIWKIYMGLYETDLAHRDWLYSGKIALHPTEYIAEIIGNIASGINYLHNVQVIHADIKPANILHNIRNRKTIICDFNCSIFLPRKRMTSYVQTPGYRAPEINLQKSQSKYDYSIDVWSLGCVLYELVTAEYFIPTDYVSDDTTEGLCAVYHTTAGKCRKARMKMLLSMKPAETQCMIARRVSQSRWRGLLSAKHSDFSELFMSFCIRAMARCLSPDHKTRHRATLFLNYWQENVSNGLFGFRAKEQSEIIPPLCSLHIAELLADAFADISVVDNPRSRKAAQKNLAKKAQELKLFCVIDGKLSNCARLIELNYYKLTQTHKYETSRESQLIYSSAIYLASAIMNMYPPAEIFAMFSEKKIYEKSMSIMRTLDNKLIF